MTRNVAIVVLIAAAVYFLPSGGQVASTFEALIYIGFGVAIGYLGLRYYRENRVALHSLGDRYRGLLYGAIALGVLPVECRARACGRAGSASCCGSSVARRAGSFLLAGHGSSAAGVAYLSISQRNDGRCPTSPAYICSGTSAAGSSTWARPCRSASAWPRTSPKRRWAGGDRVHPDTPRWSPRSPTSSVWSSLRSPRRC